MANTLYIVDDDLFSRQPQVVRDTTLAETQNLFAFVKNFKVLLQQPSKFPTRFDFTDSVVKVVESDGDVSAFHNQSVRTQTSNLAHSAKQNGITLNTGTQTRNAGVPERGGIGFQSKDVLTAGSQKLAFVLTGGAASLETVKEAVAEFNAGGRSKNEILADKKKAIEGTSTRKGLGLAGYYGRHQSLVDIRGLMAWELVEKPLADWPKDDQISVATALARLIAHEARHQYIAPHYNGGGLGASEASLWGDKNFAAFDQGDQKEVGVALANFTKLQKTATIHLETNPTNQPFPY
ncbi:hypothetical protein [Mesorhizobium sp. IMUNJ 23232]|uniref:hypothetical protein n=1 Tax=Mesorhizobium sp. IMUNJ 23232 TaxID=3376064 RepID=UPI00378FEE68